MGKNDFDIDFDFEKEYGFDPKTFQEEADTNIDLTAFPDQEDLSSAAGSFELEDEAEDFLNMASRQQEYEDESELEDDGDWEEDSYIPDPEPDAPEETEMDELEYTQRFEPQRGNEPQEYEEYDEGAYADGYSEEYPQDYAEDEVPEYSEDYEEQPQYDEEPSEEEDEPAQRRQRKKVELPQFKMPVFLTKFYDLFFAPVFHKELQDEPVDPEKPRRRRKSRRQIFKEFYLPPIIVCTCLILVLSFCIGTLSNAIALKEIEKKKEQSQLDASLSAAEQAAIENQKIVDRAAELAAGYDYQGAIDLLNTINGGDLTGYQEIGILRSEYETIKSQLVEHKEPSLIPNLSFHVLIADMARAQRDTDQLKGSYNRNFVTIGEFEKILEELYNNGFVLVDFDSFVTSQTDLEGTEKFFVDPILLPSGKKPVMITETMVNYFEYMIDSDADGMADAKGDGFASRLVLVGDDIKAEYVNENGETLVGNYDLVPILEDFIKEHPDFSYRGARATLAVTGDEGVFGYRCNTTYQATKGKDYYDQQVAGAKTITQALKDKGYTIACYTYSNKAYAGKSVSEISAELQSWTTEVTNIIGPVDTFVFAKNSDLSDYSGQAFNVMYQSGFRYFVAHSTSPSTEVNTTYVRQKRLLVTGENMRHYSSQFTDLGLFNPNTVLEMNTRGEIPKLAS